MEKLLEAQHDSGKSFYGKAKVIEEFGCKFLISYKSCICKIRKIGDQEQVTIYDVHYYCGDSLTFSPTSLRHLKEFLLQNGCRADNKEYILKNYTIEEGGQTDGFSKGSRR